MNKYKICVYAICKNEEQFVDRWMDSMAEADEIIVTDTGSTDETVNKLRARGAVVYCEEIKPWRFDVARNRSLANVPGDTDIAVCTDLDEVLRPGWRALIEEHWQPGKTMGNYLYNWSLNPDNTPNTQFIYFKIHVPGCYQWRCPAHEYLQFIPNEDYRSDRKVFIPGLILDHYPDAKKSRSSYLGLLEMGAREDVEDTRMAYYLGREYMYAGQWHDCIAAMTRYLAMPNATWGEERCAAMRWIAKSYRQLGDNAEAYRWYYRAIAEEPKMRDAYVECAKEAYSLGDWVTVYFMVSEALKITQKTPTFVNQGYAWDHTPDDLAAIALWQLGNYELALKHATRALEITPGDDRLKKNRWLIERSLSQKG
ncbi:MAG: glycosyltransferase family 2 protein [Lachnospiraceae bacterium]|nr:glycosyltransferase family 2 protein [Lachnospiraceae bacterium]